MESRFGHDFSHVRVHLDSRAGESAQAVNALAYTVGQNIVFAHRQYAPQTTFGQRLLAHELTHVVQQSGVDASVMPSLKIGEADDVHEREADALADRIVESHSASATTMARGSVQQLRRQQAHHAETGQQLLQRQTSKHEQAESGATAIPYDFIPGISQEKDLFPPRQTLVETPEYFIHFKLSLVGSVKLAPTHSVLTVTGKELELDFEKFKTGLTFKYGGDLSFSSVSVGFGPHKAQTFKSTITPLGMTAKWSSVLSPPELILGRLKVGGKMSANLEAEFISKSSLTDKIPPRTVPEYDLKRFLWDVLKILTVIATIPERIAVPIFVMPFDNQLGNQPGGRQMG
jgi:hypothetical protein